MRVVATTEATKEETYRPKSDPLSYVVEYRVPDGDWSVCMVADELQVAEVSYDFCTKEYQGLLFRIVELDTPVKVVPVDV